MIYLNKLLPLFIMPSMIIIYLLIYGVWKNKRKVICTAIIFFYVTSTPVFSNNFFKLVEGSEVRKQPINISNADAIVVLSGMINNTMSTTGVYPEWVDPDRFFGGIELFKTGKAPMIIFTGGKMPWDTIKSTEGEILKKFALQFGVPDSAVVVTGRVENTSDEATKVVNLLGVKKKIILVTSAFHMRRASSLFRKQGLQVITYKVDFKANILNKLTVMDFLPNANSFLLVHIAFRELLGVIVYEFS